MADPYSAKATKGEDEPLAYKIGDQPFLGLTIYLDSHPLIPRPETEWWTEQLITAIQTKQEASRKKEGVGLARPKSTRGPILEALRSATARAGGKFSAENYSVLENRTSHVSLAILDLCAGSGAIGCALLSKIPNAHVFFGELDPSHETTITKNIQQNNLDASRASVRIGNLFIPFENKVFDFIAINPPYIPSERILQKSVSEYEPALALFSENDGLGLIRRIATELPQHLKKGGSAWIECDHSNIHEARTLFEAAGFTVEIHSDQYQVPRILVVSFP